MKKLIYIVSALLAAGALWSCNPDDGSQSTWDRYQDWREANDTWFAEQETRMDDDGYPYYVRVTPQWNSGATVLMHWFNDRAETAGNLTPMLTSTVETRYMGRLYNDEKFDSTAVGDLFTTRVSGVVEGWQIALMNMNVGDSCEIVFRYPQGYGATSTGSIPPYSALRFNMRLVNITGYEIRPPKN
ncbi:MAG: FKBP-type peptidyl-prolyl cis-trans isomerase [Muribaculaceae bacterium]|nr:FKBP-type peptidyl-prolyl cis-trans isomerase [Muribaculaceae bacterium]